MRDLVVRSFFKLYHDLFLLITQVLPNGVSSPLLVRSGGMRSASNEIHKQKKTRDAQGSSVKQKTSGVQDLIVECYSGVFREEDLRLEANSLQLRAFLHRCLQERLEQVADHVPLIWFWG